MLNETFETTEAVRLPRLNEPAPDFEAVTTHGSVRLSDYRGKWMILFSHPADFTPVCTTEFIGFAEIYPELQKRNVDLLGLSIDSVYSHIAWVRNIEEKIGVKIPFPVNADLSATVARLYGMIMPGASATETVRAVFVIDPEGILRAMIYYPFETDANSCPKIFLHNIAAAHRRWVSDVAGRAVADRPHQGHPTCRRGC